MVLHIQTCQKEYALPIDTNGRCITAKNVCTSNEIPRYSAKEPPMKWECSSECKILSDSDVYTIIDLDIVLDGRGGVSSFFR